MYSDKGSLPENVALKRSTRSVYRYTVTKDSLPDNATLKRSTRSVYRYTVTKAVCQTMPH